MKKFRYGAFLCLLMFVIAIGLAGCEETDMSLATQAGVDALKAATLSDAAVAELSEQSAMEMDVRHAVASQTSRYAQRLTSLVGGLHELDGYSFNYKVYLQDDVNAFALADGTIRVYSGLMDLLNDGELRFVIGHEMGHIVNRHIGKKLRLAYAASALRKGVASQNSMVGDLAGSQLGGLVERLMGAQFSQFEEKVADDYGLFLLQENGYAPGNAVSALNKLAALGSGHSFLSSHPDPSLRAARLQLQIQGKDLSIAQKKQDLGEKAKAKIIEWYTILRGYWQKNESSTESRVSSFHSVRSLSAHRGRQSIMKCGMPPAQQGVILQQCIDSGLVV